MSCLVTCLPVFESKLNSEYLHSMKYTRTTTIFAASNIHSHPHRSRFSLIYIKVFNENAYFCEISSRKVRSRRPPMWPCDKILHNGCRGCLHIFLLTVATKGRKCKCYHRKCCWRLSMWLRIRCFKNIIVNDINNFTAEYTIWRQYSSVIYIYIWYMGNG